MNENKKTDREKLIELLDKFFYGDFDSPYVIYFTESECAIIADYLLSHGVTFEKQGEWEHDMFYGEPYKDEWYDTAYKCSLCGGIMLGKSDYCPNCGAKMKGENNG